MIIDPVCLVHGKRWSEHLCLFCALCYKDLTQDKCNKLPDGSIEDVCIDCAEREKELINAPK